VWKGKVAHKKTKRLREIKRVIISPDARAKAGWAKYGDPVVVIDIKDEDVCIKTGFICSTTISHTEADNIRRTIVWGDELFNPDADNADDAHEKGFDVFDYHLLKAEEAKVLSNPQAAIKWFEGIHTSYLSRSIASALSSAKLVVDRKAMQKLFADLMS